MPFSFTRLRARSLVVPVASSLALGVAFSLSLTLGACSSNDSKPTGDGGVTPDAATGDAAPAPAACTKHLAPGADVQNAVQTALIEAKAGEVLCFDDGVYAFTKELSLTGRNVTIRGTNPGKAIWDFRGQEATARNGMLVSADDFTIQDLVIKNTAGDGIRVEGVKNVVFRRLRVLWELDAYRPDKDGVPRSGAYAVYPVNSEGILIEECEVTEARDAGIYVGQSKHAVVRNNKVHASVAGVEIENTTDSEVYGNDVYDNTAGILVFNLPDLPVQDGKRANIHDNDIHDNNRANFGIPGTSVAGVPAGTGALILAADETEFAKNKVTNNDSTGLLIVSCRTNNSGPDCTSSVPYNQFAMATWVHDNTFDGNGKSPAELLKVAVRGEPGAPVEAIIWDGDKDVADTRQPLCLKGNTGGTVRNLDFHEGFVGQTNSDAPYKCELPNQPAL